MSGYSTYDTVMDCTSAKSCEAKCMLHPVVLYDLCYVGYISCSPPQVKHGHTDTGNRGNIMSVGTQKLRDRI